MARAQIQYGSQGSDVRELQKILNQSGYKLTEDGIFGEKTQAAVKDYQEQNGLDVDGIVGTNTWTALSRGTKNNATNTTTGNGFKYNDFEYDGFEYDGFEYDGFEYDGFEYDEYQESDIVKQAQDALEKQLANKPEAYQSQWQSQLDDTINKILNREEFSYDLNGDALYQQYKDKYVQQGRMAMGDAIGQASAMTGGYGNSYAQSVGQQVYQAQLENLNDIVPELYQMALDKYNTEGQDLYNQYAMLGDRENMDYSRYRDSVSDWMAERDYLTDRYDTERNFDYSKYTDARDFAYGKYTDDRNFAYGKYTDDRNFAYSKYTDDRNFAYSKYTDDKDLTYQEYRNAIEDAFAREQFEYQKEQDQIANEQWQKQYDALYGSNSSEDLIGGSGNGDDSGNAGGSYSGDDSNGGNGGNNTGNSSSDNNNTSEVPDSIKDKAASYTDNDALDAYLTSQYNAGNITEEQMGKLYLENEVPSLQNRNWTLVNDGGVNWFWGIDNNASVKDQYGNTYKLGDLVDALVAEGMSKDEAKDYVKKLQKELGA